jgi:Zn-dependent membrane protease YugP
MNWYVDLAIAIPALILGAAAQGWVRHVVAEADAVPTAAGLSALLVAQRLLVSSGVQGVSIDTADEEFGDHYDAREKRICLWDAGSRTVAAAAIAAHEVGHAVQDAEGATSFRLRTAIAPVAAVASVGWFVLIVVGMMFGLVGLVHLAVLLFAAVAAFHLATLPVELGASRRAMALVRSGGLITAEEERIVRRVLLAAALTYLTTALISIAQIVELLFVGEE